VAGELLAHYLTQRACAFAMDHAHEWQTGEVSIIEVLI
jgi:hypothetical protein